MQGLKWRLSFNSGRPNRQLKRLWTETNIKITDGDIDIAKSKVLLSFLDSVLGSQEQQAQRLIIDELAEDLATIVCCLLHWVKLIDTKDTHALAADEITLLIDVHAKALTASEVFVSSKDTKTLFREDVTDQNPCIEYAVRVLEVAKDVVTKLCLIRIIKSIVFAEAHLLKLAELGGFRVLSEVSRTTHEAAVTSQVVHLQRLYMEYLQGARLAQVMGTEAAILSRHRAYSTSSAGSNPAIGHLGHLGHLHHRSAGATAHSVGTRSLHSVSNQALYPLPPGMSGPAAGTPAELESVDESSIAAKGLNMAFSIVSELLKFAPISADWLGGAGRRDADRALVDASSAYLEEQQHLAGMLQASSVLDIEAERVRALFEKGTGMEGAVSLDVDTMAERSQLYPRTQAGQRGSSPPLAQQLGSGGSVGAQYPTGQRPVPQSTDLEMGTMGLSLSAKKSASPPVTSTTETGTTGVVGGGDALEYIRTQMLEQDITSVLLLALETAASPSEAVEALLTVQAMLVGDSIAQVSFNAMDGYNLVASMLVRVEENLPLLAPCSEQSMAVASGQPAHQPQAQPAQPQHQHQQLQPRRSMTSITSSVSSGSGPSLPPGLPHGAPPGPPSPRRTASSVPGLGMPADPSYRRPTQFPHDGQSEPMGLYGTFVKGEFDSYYSTLVMVLLNIILDDLSTHQLCPGTNLPVLPAKGSEIRNFKSVALVVALLAQPTVGLNTVALRVCFALMRLHAPNVAALEVLGVVSALVEKLLAIVYTGSLDSSLLTATFASSHTPERPDYTADLSPTKTEDYSGPTTDSSAEDQPAPVYSAEVLGTMTSEVVLLLQIVAVSTANRDDSVLALLALVLQHSAASHCRLPHTADVRCQNCETEVACLQCLNDGCMNDRASLLCQECDNVFHKSAVKKSHIRIPVHSAGTGAGKVTLSPSGDSREKLVLSRGNSTSSDQDDGQGGFPRGVGPMPAAQLLKELNEYARAPLQKHSIVDASGGALLAPRDVPSRNEFTAAVILECVHCILLGGLRGILDDREVRGMDKVAPIAQPLLRCLRATVCTPFLPVAALGQEEIHSAFRREMNNASESLKLSELLDGRADVLHPGASPDSPRGEARWNADAAQQPPEVSHPCPRRIRLVLLVQCLGAFLVPRGPRDLAPSLFVRRDDAYREMKASFQQAVEVEARHEGDSQGPNGSGATGPALVLQQLVALSGDALLVHLLLDASAYTQLTWSDRQFILWLLREAVVLGAACKSEHSGRILHWLQWILRANVVSRRGQVDHTARFKQTLFGRKPAASKPGSLGLTQPLRTLTGTNLLSSSVSGKPLSVPAAPVDGTYAAVPTMVPTITLLMRLLLVQELRLLLGDGTEKPVAECPRVFDSLHAVRLKYIPLQVEATIWAAGHSSHGCGHGTPGGASTPSGTNQRKTAMGAGAGTSAAAQSAALQQRGVPYHTLSSTFTLRSRLVETGFVETLVDLLFGELCSISVYKLLCQSIPLSASHRGSSQSYYADFAERESRWISDMEKEEWWSAFATLAALLAGCDAAKDRVHTHVGTESFVRFLMQHMAFLSTLSQGKLNGSTDYRSVLNTFVVELCLRQGRFALLRDPFTCAVSRMPQHHGPQVNWTFSDGGFPGGGDDDRFLPLYTRANSGRAVDSAAPASGSAMARKGIAAHAATSPLGGIAGALHSSVVVCNTSPTTVSSAYFSQDRSMVLARYLCRPCPLALQSDRLRKAFASAGPTMVQSSAPPAASANTGVQPAKHHIPVSRGSVKSGDALEVRSRMSGESDANLPQFAGLSGGLRSETASHTGSVTLISRRLVMRRNISTASVHSAESDSRWDQNSIGLDSSAHDGRASFQSYHSLLALTQALTSSHANTPTASVCGDGGHGGHYGHHAFHRLGSAPGQVSRAMTETDARPDYRDEQTLLRSPFPPMVASGSGSVPRVFAPVFGQLGLDGDSGSATLALMLLHHALLVRAGYSESVYPHDPLDSPTRDDYHRSQSRQYSEDPFGNPDSAVGLRMSMISTDSAHGSAAPILDHLPPMENHFHGREPVNTALVLRKHLAMFIAPVVGGASLQQEVLFQPAYSRLQLATAESCELLLSAAVVAAPEDQLFLISTLSQLLDGNPVNAHGFTLKPTTCVALARLVPTLHEETQEKVGYLLSQVLRYSLQQPVLRELLDVVKRSRSLSDDFGASLSDSTGQSADAFLTALPPVADNRSLLFVMGRTAERTGPEAFVHFDQSSAFQCAVDLPSIPPPPQGTPPPTEVTVCSWLRLGALADAPTASFLQVYSASSGLLVNSYFRVLYKSGQPSHDKVGGIAVAASSQGGDTYSRPPSRRVVQLCLSFGKGVAAVPGLYENGISLNDEAVPGKPVDKSMAATVHAPFATPSSAATLPPAPAAAAASLSGLVPNSHSADSRAAAESLSAVHWTHAVAGLSGLAERPNRPDGADSLKAATVTMATLLSQYTLPDAVVEFDWAEMGDWHLLTLGLSDRQVTCSVDGVAVPILHWTPLGYEYDVRSAGIKAEMESVKPSIPSLANAAAEAVRYAPGQYDLDLTKGYPFQVALGGLRHERGSYETLAAYVQQDNSGEDSAGLTAALQAVVSVVGGLVGSMGETLVIAGPVEESKVQAWVREGPLNGFRDMRLPRVSGLTATAMRSAELSAGAAQKAAADPPPLVIAFPSLLGSSPADAVPSIDDSGKGLKVYATSGVVSTRDRDSGRFQSGRDRDLVMGVRFSSHVQVHITAALSNAFSKIGGVKALYPLLAADKSRMVAALRIVASLISRSKDAYQEFRTVEADKVLLYCAMQNPRLVSLETIQVLFDLIVSSGGDVPVTMAPLPALPPLAPGATISSDTLHRLALLEMLVELVVALPRHSHLARATIDWLREVCDDNLLNCQKLLKTPGLLPVLIMLSSWELPGCEALPRVFNTSSTNEAAGTLQPSQSSAPKSTGASAATDAALEPQQARTRRERSLSLGSAPEKPLVPRSTQAIDISRAAVASAASGGHFSMNVAAASTIAAEGIGALSAGRLLEGDERAVFEGRMRLLERVNKEFTQKTQSNEQELQVALAAYAEKHKMQLTCARFLRLLIAGTSGEVSHGSALHTANLLCTATDFAPQHLAMLLSFAVVACGKGAADDALAQPRNIDYVRDKERRKQAARVKKLIYGTFSGIPILRQLDVSAPSYWLSSAALVALDAILDASTSALQMQVTSLLKACFSGTTLQSMMIRLMASECVEVRERALRILLLSFSNLDGKLDVKQVGYFDRIHGFQCVAEQLGAHQDGCTDPIIHGVLNLIFWQRTKRRGSSSTGSDGATDRRSSVNTVTSTTSGDEDEGFYPIREASPGSSRRSSVEPRESKDPRQQDPRLRSPSDGTAAPGAAAAPADIVARSTPASPVPVAGPAPALKADAGLGGVSPLVGSAAPAPVAPTATSTAATGGSSSIMSLFSWGGSTANSTVVAKPVGAEEAPPSTDQHPKAEEGGKAVDASAGDVKPHLARDRAVSDAPVNHIEELRTTVQNQKMYAVEVMEVPQALEVLFRVMQNCTSVDQVGYVFKVVEQSVSVVIGANTEHAAAVNQIHLRNAESLFNQKDWLWWLCDLLVLYRRMALNAEDRDGSASVFSLSESESVGGYYGGGNPDIDDASDVNSIAGDSVNEDHVLPVHRGAYKSSVGSAESVSGRVSAWQQNLIDQYTGPIYSLLRKLLLQDMVTGRVGSSRRWNELCRISLPELNSIQERLLLDLVGAMQHLSEFCEDANAMVNLLKNLAAVLEQALEKADMSLMFNVKVVTALHSLSYNCPPDVRSRIKETGLPEIRKGYVARVLMDNTQDFYTRVAAISEISSPLQGYMAVNETKVLSDTTALMIVMGMLVEACEDLEFLLGGVDSSTVVLNESAGQRGAYLAHDDARMMASPIPASTFDRVHVLFEVLEVLIESVQNCAIASSECKKALHKLFGSFPADPNGYLLSALLRTFGMRPYSQRSGSGTLVPDNGGAASSTAMTPNAATTSEADNTRGTLSRGPSVTGASASQSAPAPVPQPPSSSTSSYTWWGGWSGVAASGDAVVSTAATDSANPGAGIDVGPGIKGGGERTAMQSGGPHEDQEEGPTNIKTFIAWFCAIEQKEVQAEFRQRVLGEIRNAHRTVDKLREKNVQRYMRHTRQAQDKRAREKVQVAKTAKDALALCKSASDKIVSKFQRDTKTWVSGLNDKFEAGKVQFQSSLEERSSASVKSPLRDTKSSAQTPATYTVTFSDPLRSYLRQHGAEAEGLDRTAGAGVSGSSGSYDACAALDDLLGAFKSATAV